MYMKALTLALPCDEVLYANVHVYAVVFPFLTY